MTMRNKKMSEETSTKRKLVCKECKKEIQQRHSPCYGLYGIEGFEFDNYINRPINERNQKTNELISQIANTEHKPLLYCGYCNDALEFLSEDGVYSCCNTGCEKLTIVYYQKDVRN